MRRGDEGAVERGRGSGGGRLSGDAQNGWAGAGNVDQQGRRVKKIDTIGRKALILSGRGDACAFRANFGSVGGYPFGKVVPAAGGRRARGGAGDGRRDVPFCRFGSLSVESG